jgi:hypothetical protein
MQPHTNANWFKYFPENYRWSAGFLLPLSTAPWGSCDIGEVDQVGTRLKRKIGDDAAWFREWIRIGKELEAKAAEAASKRFFVTASDFYFRACMYYQTGERFRYPKDQEALEVYRSSINSFNEAAKNIKYPSIEYVEIPYQGIETLPALFVKGSTEQKDPLPTVIFFDGLDVSKEICYFRGVRDLIRRGIACLLVDLPGIGECIRFKGLKLRFDPEIPTRAAVDYLENRPEIDPNKIGIMALSLGGYHAPRSAALEKRLKACVAWGAIWDYHAVWKRRAESTDKGVLSVPESHIMWVLGASSMEDALCRLEKFRLSGIVEQIECPFLLVHGQDDAQISVEDARTCFKAVGSKDKTLKVFTAEEGGSQHCQMGSLGIAVPYIQDWLVEKLR